MPRRQNKRFVGSSCKVPRLLAGGSGATPTCWLPRSKTQPSRSGISGLTGSKTRSYCRRKLAEDADPVDELQVLMDEVSTDGAFRAEAAEHLDQIIRALPAELRDRYGHNESSTAAVLDRLIADGTKDVIAALKTGQVEREAL